MSEETAVRIATALEALVMIHHKAISAMSGDEEDSGPLIVMTQHGAVEIPR